MGEKAITKNQRFINALGRLLGPKLVPRVCLTGMHCSQPFTVTF